MIYLRIGLIALLIFSLVPSFGQQVIDKIMQSPPEFPPHLTGPEEPMGNFLEPGLFAHTRPLFELFSATNQQFVGTRNGALYLRKIDNDSVTIIAQPAQDWKWSLDGAVWSPDGRYLVAKQINDKDVPRITLSHKTPDEVTTKAYTRAGQTLPTHQYYFVDVASKKVTAIDHGQSKPYVHVLSWSDDSQYIRCVRTDRFMKNMDLFTVEREKGKVTTILSEKSSTYLIGLNLLHGYTNRLRDMNLFWFLDKRQQFIYTNEKSGTNQLYLYDTEGRLISPLTDASKNGVVTQLVKVDILNEWAYFYGNSDPSHPYDTQLFRSSLNGNRIEKLLNGPTILDVQFSKGMDSLWVFRTGLPNLMQIDNYTSSGRFIETTWQANLAPKEEAGFNPEYAQSLASDGKTLLEAFILKPKGFDSLTSYPVVEYIYGGPHTAIIPRHFFDRSMWNMQNLANKGFIVVMIDSRGTPSRGKSFQDYTYAKFGQLEIQEHVNVLKQLGKERAYMNLNNVGIIGHSWGGYFALKALVEFPTFYKAGHVNAAAVDPRDFRVAIEPFMGCTPKECPEKYDLAGITNKLHQLKAPLMIVHGTADDDVPIDEAYKLIESLQNNSYENFEFLEYQGFDHIVMRNRSWEPTMIDFFSKHLLEK